jgi:hypothetical protein
MLVILEGLRKFKVKEGSGDEHGPEKIGPNG